MAAVAVCSTRGIMKQALVLIAILGSFLTSSAVSCTNKDLSKELALVDCSLGQLTSALDKKTAALVTTLVDNADAMFLLFDGWINNLAQLSYRGDHKLVVPVSDSVLEYDLGAMSGDLFSPLEAVQAVVYKKNATVQTPSVMGFMHAWVKDRFASKSKSDVAKLEWLTGGSIKPVYVFLIKYLLLLKDLKATQDVGFFIQESMRLLFRLKLSGDIDMYAVSLQKALPLDVADLMKLVSKESYEFLDIIFAELSGMSLAGEQKAAVSVFVFSSDVVAQSLTYDLVASNFDEQEAILLKSLEDKGFECVSYEQLVAMNKKANDEAVESSAAIASLDPRNQLYAKVEFADLNNITTYKAYKALVVTVPAACSEFGGLTGSLAKIACDFDNSLIKQDANGLPCLVCVSNVGALKLTPARALVQIVIEHLKMFEAYVNFRKMLLTENQDYKQQVKKDVDLELLLRSEIAPFLKTAEGKIAADRLQERLSLIAQGSFGSPALIDSGTAIINDEISNFVNMSLILQYRADQAERSIASLQELIDIKNIELQKIRNTASAHLWSWVGVDSAAESVQALSVAMTQLAMKKAELIEIQDKLADVQAKLLDLRKRKEEQQKLERMQSSRKEKLSNMFYELFVNQSAVISKDLLRELEQALAQDSLDIAQLGLTVSELVLVRQACAAVYEDEAHQAFALYRSSKQHAWVTYARYLEEVAKTIRDENEKLLPLGIYMEQKRKGFAPALDAASLRTMTLVYQELGYLLNPASYQVVIDQVQQSVTKRFGLVQFFKDMQDSRFDFVRAQFTSAIDSIVKRCDVLADNQNLVQYFKQHYMPYLIEEIA